MNLKLFRLHFLLILITLPVFAYAQTVEEKLREIDAYAEKTRTDWNVPGMAIAIVKDDKVIFAKGYGVKNIGSSPTATYKKIYKAVKDKNTEAIKREMSAETNKFVINLAERQNKKTDEIYVNGFSATTFSADLPEIRDERLKDNFGAVEVYNANAKRWEDLPFVYENGDWKLAIGEIFAGNYKQPGKSISQIEEEKKADKTNKNYVPIPPYPSEKKLSPISSDESNAVNENTLFAIASNSKAFTTAALAILADENKINWDDKVIKHLPEFELADAYVTREMTVRDLVSHRSGFDTFSGDLLWYETTYKDDDILKRLRYLKPKTSFRSSYGYQNLMFVAAGKIVERVSGKSWSEFVRERILAPLGMSRTTTTIKDLKDNFSMPHNESGGTLRALHLGNVDGATAAAGLNSSVADVAKWLRLQLGRGKYEGKQIFSEKQSWEMWQQATAIPISQAGAKFIPSRHFNGYGLGWFLWDYHGRKVVSHGGGLDGMISETAMMPEENLGLVVLTNSETPVNVIIQNKIFDVFADAPKRDWSAEYLTRAKAGKAAETEARAKLEASRVKNTKPSLAAKDYAGTYAGELYGDVVVAEENGKMVLRFTPSPKFVADLEHWHYDTFRIKWRPSVAYNFPPGYVTFMIDKNGKPGEIKIDQPNNDFWFYELELKRTK